MKQPITLTVQIIKRSIAMLKQSPCAKFVSNYIFFAKSEDSGLTSKPGTQQHRLQ